MVAEANTRTQELVVASDALSASIDDFYIGLPRHRSSQGLAFDPSLPLARVADRLQEFGRLVRDAGRVNDFDRLDPEKLRAKFTFWFGEDESRAAYCHAEEIFRAAIVGKDVGPLIRLGWFPAEPEMRAAREAARMFVVPFARRVAAGGRHLEDYAKDLSVADALTLATELREQCLNLGQWTSAELHRAGLDLDTLAVFLRQHVPDFTLPPRWKEFAPCAAHIMEGAVNAISRLVEPVVSLKSLPANDVDPSKPREVRRKGEKIALAIELKRQEQYWDLDRKRIAGMAKCDRSLLSNPRYRDVEAEVERKAKLKRRGRDASM
jgi:hypothetical protein